jgi:hypothetical protein
MINKNLFKIILLAGVFFSATTFVAQENKVFAQSFTLTPSSGTITVSGTQSVTITATNPTATNSAAIRISVPGSLVNITDLTTPVSGYISLPGTGCSAMYTTTQICFDIAKTGGGNFTNGELIGTFELTGMANGVANVNFVAGNRYSGSSDYTGTGGTFTIGSGGGSPVDGGGTVGTPPSALPSTGLFDEFPYVWIGLTFVMLGATVYVFNSRWYRNDGLNFTKLDSYFVEKMTDDK